MARAREARAHRDIPERASTSSWSLSTSGAPARARTHKTNAWRLRIGASASELMTPTGPCRYPTADSMTEAVTGQPRARQSILQAGDFGVQGLRRTVGGQVGEEARDDLFGALVRECLQYFQRRLHRRPERRLERDGQPALRGVETARQADGLQARPPCRETPP